MSSPDDMGLPPSFLLPEAKGDSAAPLPREEVALLDLKAKVNEALAVSHAAQDMALTATTEMTATFVSLGNRFQGLMRALGRDPNEFVPEDEFGFQAWLAGVMVQFQNQMAVQTRQGIIGEMVAGLAEVVPEAIREENLLLRAALREQQRELVSLMAALGLPEGSTLDRAHRAAAEGQEALRLWAEVDVFHISVMDHVEQECPENCCRYAKTPYLDTDPPPQDKAIDTVRAAVKLIDERNKKFLADEP